MCSGVCVCVCVSVCIFDAQVEGESYILDTTAGRWWTTRMHYLNIHWEKNGTTLQGNCVYAILKLKRTILQLTIIAN